MTGDDKGNFNPANAALTRNDVAQMALNALEADVVEPDGNGGTTIKGDGFEITINVESMIATPVAP